MHILNNGNIGFGTNAPSASFDIVGASRFRNSLTLNYGTANRTTQIRDNGFYISRTTDGTYTNAITADASMSLITRGDFKFVSNAIERVTFLETGNVGIGNTNPSYKLDVSGTFRGTNLVSQVPVGNVTSLRLLNQDGTMLGSFETDAGASTYLRSFFNLTIDPNTSGAGGSYVKITTLSGTGTRMVVADHNGILSTQAIPVGGGGGNWNLNGNNIVNANTGFVSIGSAVNPAPADPELKLAVNGNIYAKKLKVTLQGWADYVFEPTYKLMPLRELEAYINKNKHLPDVPSATDVETKGLDLGDNQTILLKKIEELTLYVIELKKEIDSLKGEKTTQSKKK
jgi:hypothetical protein